MSIASLCIPLLEGKIIDSLIFLNDSEFKKYIILLIFDMILSICLSALSSFIYFKLQALCGNEANMEAIRHLYLISYSHLLNKDPAVLNQSINNDCNTILIFCLSSLQKVIVSILSMFMIVYIVSQYSLYFIVLMIVSILAYVCVYFFYKGRLYEVNREVLNSSSVFFGALYQLVYYLKSIKMCSLYRSVQRFEEKMFSNFYEDAKKQTVLECSNDFVSNFISLLTQVLIYILGAYFILNNQITVGILMVLANYYSNILSNVQVLIDFGNDVQKCKASYDRLNELLQIKSNHVGNKKLNEVNIICVKDLSFAYPNAESLFYVNYQFEKGNIYRIQGKNGSGKSTLLQVLTGVFEQDYQGYICVDGIDVKNLDWNTFLSNHVSVCMQEPFILEDTLLYNLALDKEYNQQLKDLLMGFHLGELSNQMDQILHPLNLGLSGGQRQKIGLIRTLYSDADVLIFDEPISALDVESKQYFKNYLSKIQDKIILLVSHDDLEGLNYKSLHLSL